MANQGLDDGTPFALLARLVCIILTDGRGLALGVRLGYFVRGLVTGAISRQLIELIDLFLQSAQHLSQSASSQMSTHCHHLNAFYKARKWYFKKSKYDAP